MDSIPFTSFSETGGSTSDTLDQWRLKSNGIPAQLQTVSTAIDSLYSGVTINYVTLNGDQTITGTKSFGAGSSSAPILKIGATGLYYESSILKSTSPIQAGSVIATNTLGLGSNLFTVPTGSSPSSTSYLTGNSGVLSWKDETSLSTSILGQITSISPGILNQIIPVGTIIAYSGATIPTGWKECDGSIISSVTYPELYALLGTTYGSLGKLPDLKGRSIIGRGIGTDSITTQTFIAGSYGGLYKHTLITTELPTHNHDAGTLITASAGAHTHSITINKGRYGTGDIFGTANRDMGAGYGTFETTSTSAGAHTHSITGSTGSIGSSTSFSILQPYLSTIYIIKALPDTIVNTQLSAGDGIQFTKTSDSSNTSSFNLSASDTYTVAVKHNSSLAVVGGVLSVATITGSEIAAATITPNKLSAVSGGYISWDGTHAYYTNGSGTSPLLTQFSANLNGPVQQLREKTHGDTSAISWQEYAYINNDNNVVITGTNRYSMFGACNAFGHQIMPLPLNRKVSKLYISEYSMACIDTTGQLWAIGRNSYNQFNLVSGSTADLTTWTQAFPQITNIITKVVLSSYTTYVLDNDNNLWAAGYNVYGQLGNSTNINTSDVGYQTVASNTTVSDMVVCGSETLITVCIMSTNNQIYTCGYGGNGQIGNGSVGSKNTWTIISKPSELSDWSNYVLYSKGYSGNGGFFIKSNNGASLYAWGYNGDNTFGKVTTPIISLPYKIWDGTSTGNINKFYPTHATGVTYILTVGKQIYATGNNTCGNFGNSGTTSVAIWTDITSTLPSGYTLTDLYVSDSNSAYCSAIIRCTKSGESFLFGTGSNFNGQLGNAGVTIAKSSWTPILINSDIITNIKDVQLGYNNNSAYSLLMLNDGELYWAGYNDFYFDSGIEPSWNNGQYRTIFNRVK